jgi:hypothetical protein
MDYEGRRNAMGTRLIWLPTALSDHDAVKRKYHGIVAMEPGSVVNDSLTDLTKILDLAVAQVGQKVSQSVDILLLQLLLVAAIFSELRNYLSICNPYCVSPPFRSTFAGTYQRVAWPQSVETGNSYRGDTLRRLVGRGKPPCVHLFCCYT